MTVTCTEVGLVYRAFGSVGKLAATFLTSYVKVVNKPGRNIKNVQTVRRQY